MKKYFTLILLFISASQIICAQQIADTTALRQALISYPMKDLEDADMIKLSSLPELKIPANYQMNKTPLPYMVDNSTQPYFRPIGWQQGYECGQSAGIAYNFTYELCRLKNISAQVLSNQIVTHFSWDFLNGGQQYVGASAFDGYEIVRAAGSPNAVDYGGSLDYGGHTRWMSGYNTYYAAMHNRLNTAYQLNVSTEEGLNILKHWLCDHLEGSPVGGVVNFYGGYFSPTETLPAGTPEGGKALKTSWSGSSHTWTICGYNDSIRYDYNGDGQYTNNIDINGDGVVNMKDWEIGGLKFANGYYSTGWGNSGFCYMTYKCLADASGAGGIWNNTVFVLGIKENCDPQLTYKATVTHTCRNMLRIRAGIALNTSATKPEYFLDFPIFNYQGGAFYMQGDTSQAAKTLELGLDCTPLLSYLNPGQQAKYFLEVYEKDPSGTNSGQVVNYSVISYYGGMQENICSSSNVPIANNDTTRLSVVRTVNFSKVAITTDTIGPANIGEDFTMPLTAANGSLPYRWDIDWTASETQAAASFPTFTTQQLVFQSSNNSYATVNLGFNFPFCGENFNKIYVNPSGFIKFENGLYTWPFIIDKDLLYKQTKLIGAFVADLTGVTAWFQGDANSATIRWTGSISGQSGSLVNVALKLYPNGKIEFYYGNISMTAGTHWLSGFSKGDNRNYQFTKASSAFATNSTPFCITFVPPVFPHGLALSEDGIISGNTSDILQNALIPIRVTDNNNIWATKKIPFSTQGVIIEYSLQSGTDTIVQAGETPVMSIKIKNVGLGQIVNGVLKLSDQDTLVSLVDSTEIVGTLNAGDSAVLPNAFTFLVDPATEGGHEIYFDTKLYTVSDTFNLRIRVVVQNFILKAGSVTVADGNNNQLEPGENAALIIGLTNIGGATASDIDVHLSCGDPYITVTSPDTHIDTLMQGETSNMFFLINASSSLPTPRIIVFNLDITAVNGFHGHDFVVLIIGENGETFESGDFTAFPWILTGNTNWYVQDTMVYMGAYASKSGRITHNQSSTMTLSGNVLADGNIRFVRKVSCEQDATNHNYDYLAFYIDGVEKQRWDGNQDWAEVSFPVVSGNHSFKWSYVKDYSVSSGLDAALLDNIVFPAMGDVNPDLTINPLSLYMQLPENTVDTNHLMLSNNGSGLIIYNSSVEYNTVASGNEWCNPQYYAGNIDGGQATDLNVIFDANGMSPGYYYSTLSISSNFMNQVSIPVTMLVLSSIGIDEETANGGLNIYPNPFRTGTTIEFAHNGGPVRIDICDISGRTVRSLVDENNMAEGTYTVFWDGTNSQGFMTEQGIYLCRISSGDHQYYARLVHVSE
jgi:hypothetical protein